MAQVNAAMCHLAVGEGWEMLKASRKAGTLQVIGLRLAGRSPEKEPQSIQASALGGALP